jgi:putative membrane protein
MSALFAFLHFVAAFGIAAVLFLEWWTMSPAPTHAEARRLQASDGWYGILAGLLLVVGFLRVMYFEKGRDFYFGNPVFHAKLGLFVLIGLISIYPTVRFIKWRAQTRQGQAPTVSAREYGLIMLALRAEVVLLVGVLLCASLMARGIGLKG